MVVFALCASVGMKTKMLASVFEVWNCQCDARCCA